MKEHDEDNSFITDFQRSFRLGGKRGAQLSLQTEVILWEQDYLRGYLKKEELDWGLAKLREAAEVLDLHYPGDSQTLKQPCPTPNVRLM